MTTKHLCRAMILAVFVFIVGCGEPDPWVGSWEGTVTFNFWGERETAHVELTLEREQAGTLRAVADIMDSEGESEDKWTWVADEVLESSDSVRLSFSQELDVAFELRRVGDVLRIAWIPNTALSTEEHEEFVEMFPPFELAPAN
jgi:hypothetical protein